MATVNLYARPPAYTRWILLLAIFAIFLLVLVLPRGTVSKTNRKSPAFRTISNLEFLGHYLEVYREASGHYPTVRDGLEILRPYLATETNLLNDGWGNPILYSEHQGGGLLTSVAADGVLGTDDDIWRSVGVGGQADTNGFSVPNGTN